MCNWNTFCSSTYQRIHSSQRTQECIIIHVSEKMKSNIQNGKWNGVPSGNRLPRRILIGWDFLKISVPFWTWHKNFASISLENFVFMSLNCKCYVEVSFGCLNLSYIWIFEKHWLMRFVMVEIVIEMASVRLQEFSVIVCACSLQIRSRSLSFKILTTVTLHYSCYV